MLRCSQAPLRDQPWNDRRAAVAERARETPLIEAVLRPGDCLYLPRGFLHAATALGGVSTHLTIGVHSWTRFALAEQLLSQALRTVAQDPAVRRSLELGVDFAESAALRGDIDLVRSALISALQQADGDQVARALQRSARNTQRAAPIGPLRQLRDASAITPETVLRLREPSRRDPRPPRAAHPHSEPGGRVPARRGPGRRGEGAVGQRRGFRGRPGSGTGPAAGAGRPGRGGVSGPPPAFRCASAARERADPAGRLGSAGPALAAARASRSVAGRRHRRRGLPGEHAVAVGRPRPRWAGPGCCWSAGPGGRIRRPNAAGW